jgi:hypothetical protein
VTERFTCAYEWDTSGHFGCYWVLTIMVPTMECITDISILKAIFFAEHHHLRKDTSSYKELEPLPPVLSMPSQGI